MKVNHFAIRDLDRAVSVSQQGSQHSDVGSFLHDAKHGVDGARCVTSVSALSSKKNRPSASRMARLLPTEKPRFSRQAMTRTSGKSRPQHVERFVPRGVIHDDDLDRTVDGVSVE